jgi:hypothetical protein
MRAWLIGVAVYLLASVLVGLVGGRMMAGGRAADDEEDA